MKKRVKMRAPKGKGIPLAEESGAAEGIEWKEPITWDQINEKTREHVMVEGIDPFSWKKRSITPFAFEPSAYRWEYRTPNLQIVVKGQRYAGLMERLLGVVRRFERETAAAMEEAVTETSPKWDWKEYPPPEDPLCHPILQAKDEEDEDSH
jgi:hypothetical protein